MDVPPNPQFVNDITGALDWWRDAGVDLDFLEEPISWLADPEDEDDANPHAERPRQRPAPKPLPVAAPDVPPAPRLDIAQLPQDLAAFREWWLQEPLLGSGDQAQRVAPQGPAGADIMVLVEEPEDCDRASLLSGPQGQLLNAILHAFGTNRDAVYLASALPRHTPGPDWRAFYELGLGQVLLHHIQLVAPKRLIVLGGNALSLIGHKSPQRPAVLRSLNHESGTIPLLAAWALPALLGQPRAKPVLWKAWLEWNAL